MFKHHIPEFADSQVVIVSELRHRHVGKVGRVIKHYPVRNRYLVRIGRKLFVFKECQINEVILKEEK